ncbi:MAG: succinyl-diaminopimelate desuccinylase, partial [Boseongicola sp. SB0670_bin_30]|nr:succinyl-diaminopimelate desuccinylase [Boseongicola sp. SB0670_bin_30]
FVCAAISFVRESPPEGAIIISVTGDEEGDAADGTAAILDWMSSNGEAMSDCIVGEPTSVETLGDTIKIGRRGSMSAHFTATGRQGHTAYPDRARNPVHVLARLMDRLASHTLDDGTEHFQPSTLAVTTIDTGNAATNVIPAACRASLNIRFNDAHDSGSLTDWLEEETARSASASGVKISMETKVSGESFLTPPGALSDLVAEAIQAETGLSPGLSTTGGSSDARFVKRHCPVVEFGLVGQTMHEVDERVEIAQITQLAAVYRRILDRYFA